MTNTQQIINEFIILVDQEKEYSRSELGKILTEVYHNINSKKKKSNDTKTSESKKKREPTTYNIFVKEQMPILKEEFPDLSRQEFMKKIGEIWKASKEAKSE